MVELDRFGGVMFRRLAVTLAVFGLVVPLVTVGRAHGGNPHNVAPSITLLTADPGFGDYLSFATTIDPTIKHPMVKVGCWQGTDLVYLEAVAIDGSPQLGGGSSEWVERGGGPAGCVADLYYNRENPRPQQIVLASTSFHADG